MSNENPSAPVKEESNPPTPFYFNPDRSIVLGDYLDILLNRTGSAEKRNLPAFEQINYSDRPAKMISSDRTQNQKTDQSNEYDGGILLPRFQKQDQSGRDVGDEGSGNIVIMGAAGTGKSTLAFQIAAACASDLNRGIAVYYSLEVSIQQFIYSMVREKTQESEHCVRIKELRDFSKCPNPDSDESLRYALEAVLQENLDANGTKAEETIQPQILLPSLSPCSISDDQASHNEVFLKRFKELELLLRAISSYNRSIEQEESEATQDHVEAGEEKQDGMQEQPTNQTTGKYTNPMVKVVVIDSINAFSNSTLNRQEIIRLMSLFKEYGIIGIFTLGDDGDQSSDAMIEASTIQYLADVVISLKCAYTNSYTHNYLEITKSRYRQQVLGKHPYKISGISVAVQGRVDVFMPGIKKKLEVLPSLHYRTNASVKSEKDEGNVKEKRKWTLFGIKTMEQILPEHFLYRSKSLTQIITIIGDSGLYKSDIAINALLNGICEGESGLIVRLSDRELFRHSGVRLSSELYTRMKKQIEKKGKSEITMYEQWSNSDASRIKRYKFDLSGWTPNFVEEGKEAHLFEVSFKSGVLYPEEMVDELLRIIIQNDIKRIVLADLKLIGVSYPFLVDSPTSGKIFLSAFLHIMRNYGVHVIITSSLSSQVDSVDQINRARILSDAVLDIKQDEGNATVSIFGEGLITKDQSEFIIRTDKKKKTKFVFRAKSTTGAVGLSTDKTALNPADGCSDKTVLNSVARSADKTTSSSVRQGSVTYSPTLESFIIEPTVKNTEGGKRQNGQKVDATDTICATKTEP